MAGRGWADWFEREEFIGQISDMRVQNLQVEREVVQKRTFTRWVNLHLEKCEPPIEVDDLFQDIQDGYVLMALLEELSGCKLLHGFKKSSHRIFRLNNIAKVLSFLEERNVKLVSIDAADVADGNASIILGLVWNIILFFQIKELTGNIRSRFPSSCSLSSIPTSSDSDASFCSAASDERRAASAALREHNKAIKKLLQWVQKRTRRFGVAVQDFGKSWTSGLAFLAVIKSIDPSLVDMRKALLRTPRENLEDAFRTSHYSLGIPRLLEPEDVSHSGPDEQSIITYVSQFLEHFPGLEEPEEPVQTMARSASLCRLHLRDGDSDHRRNGAQGSRVKERSSRFQRDCGQAPPRIFVSAARGPRPGRPATSRSWSTEDFGGELSPEEGVSSMEASQASDSDLRSPVGSVTADSAIGSPDGWVDSDSSAAPEMLSESRSDSSLCEGGTAWEVYRAVPVQIAALDEGPVPSTAGGPPEEQLCADEGIYSLGSLESTQEQAPALTDEPQPEFSTSNRSQDVPPLLDQASNGGRVQTEVLPAAVPDQPIMSLSAGPPRISEDQPSAPPEDYPDTTAATGNQTAAADADSGDGEAKGQEGDAHSGETTETLKDEGQLQAQDGTSEPLRRECQDPQDVEDKVQESEDALAPDASATATPLITVDSEPEEPAPEETSALLERRRSGPADTHPKGSACPVESPSCPAAGELRHKGAAADPEPEPPDPSDPGGFPAAQTALHADARQARRGCEPPRLHSPDPPGTQPGPEVTGEEVKGQEAQLFSSAPGRLPQLDLLHRGLDKNSPTDDLLGNPLDPMDLFYPDQDEPVFSEPPEAEAEAWPPVLSVSALEPAPASPIFEDQPPDLPGRDAARSNSKLLAATNQESDEDADREEQSCPSAEWTGGAWPGLAERETGQRTSCSARESTEPARDSGWSGDLPVAPVLRRRKGLLLAQGAENPDAATRQPDREDVGDGATSELYLLLLLWLLLYCFWLLPQMEVKMLPTLLLNL